MRVELMYVLLYHPGRAGSAGRGLVWLMWFAGSDHAAAAKGKLVDADPCI
jgi:hypothetical protein